MQIRVTNITHTTAPAGEFLDLGPDFGNHLLRAGASWQGEVGEAAPQLFMDWASKGKIRITSASTGEILFGPIEEITPKAVAPFREMNVSEDDPFGEEEPDLNEAVEISLKTHPGTAARGAHMPSTKQISTPKVRVSLGATTNDVGTANNEISPIPGDRPRSVDSSDQFTVKAPNYNAVGAVVSK